MHVYENKAFLSWQGVRNRRLNLLESSNGLTWIHKHVSYRRSADGPALSSFGGKLIWAWADTGRFNNINTAVHEKPYFEPATSLALSKSSLQKVPETLDAVMIPQDATLQYVMWGSDNDQVTLQADSLKRAQVNSQTQKKVEANVWADTVDGTHLKATCQINLN